MDKKLERNLIMGSLIVFLIITEFFSLKSGNLEFAYYIPLLVIFTIGLLVYNKELHLTNHILLAFAIIIVLHVFGGLIHLSGTRLYDMTFGILRYDNIIHAFASFISALVAYNVLRPHLDKSVKKRYVYFGLILLLLTFGLGAVNEILEFIAVVYFNAGAGVGGYVNTLKDLIFNAIGALIGVIVAIRYHLS
ncbi:DUF2238 domain-containing protein [Candidatus Woesearchaeota archaeon]|nr:DUF2238 domain-containing protein [Candidatus Woesearchaeota archaeon]MBT4248335.1 DUF2238 domain-containing protein [Candidatus Woesearchaeota archaeon]